MLQCPLVALAAINREAAQPAKKGIGQGIGVQLSLCHEIDGAVDRELEREHIEEVDVVCCQDASITLRHVIGSLRMETEDKRREQADQRQDDPSGGCWRIVVVAFEAGIYSAFSSPTEVSDRGLRSETIMLARNEARRPKP